MTRVRAFVGQLQCFSLAESLGGVESLVAHPATMTTRRWMPDARRAGRFLPTASCALSIGIEALADLKADLDRGLRRAARGLRAL